MKNKGTLTKVLAVAGTVLLGLPFLLLLVLTVAAFFSSGGKFLFDYMLPAEVLPVVLGGGVLLLWAAFRSKLYLKPLAWILGLSLLSLAACQGIAMISGLADGSREASGPIFYLVIALLLLYDVGVLTSMILGIALTRKVFAKAQ